MVSSTVTQTSKSRKRKTKAAGKRATSLVLSEETPFNVELPSWADGADDKKDEWVSWRSLAHTSPARQGLVVLASAKVVFEPMEVTSDTIVFLSVGAALPEISGDGLDVMVRFRPVGAKGKTKRDVPVIVHHIEQFDPHEPWYEMCIPLRIPGAMKGSIVVECGPGPLNEPKADWLSIYELVLAPAASLSRDRARGHRARRARGELERLEESYFSSPFVRDKDGDYAGYDPTAQLRAGDSAGTAGRIMRLKTVRVVEPEAPYHYANTLLARGLGRNPPDFRLRLQAMLESRKGAGRGPNDRLRMLSLCSGVSRIEEALLDGVPKNAVDLTLLDMNADVLKPAGSRLSEKCKVQQSVGDVNQLDLAGGSFDVILCVSALHHLIELEHVLSTVAKGLGEAGEFWSIGEYVGRRGYRLWPGSWSVANSFFKSLPEKYRVTRAGGRGDEVDEELSREDLSVNSLQAIRSEDIEPCLQRFFEPVDVHRRSCFVWRILGEDYVNNYNIHAPEDLDIVEEAAWLDVHHQRSGGRASYLNGVFRRTA